VDFRLLVDKEMQDIDKEWNNPGECERRMRNRMKVVYPCDVSHCKMWSEKYDENDIIKWEQMNKMDIREEMLEGERKLHYIELVDIIREGEQAKLSYYDSCKKEVEKEYDRRRVECYMGAVKDVEDKDLIDIAYIDSCAGEHIWRTDSGHKFLKNVMKQDGKCVRGITGDRVRLNESGTHDILGKVYMGDVVCNLISLPNLLDKGYTMKGEKDSCEISDESGRVVIIGYRSLGSMYQCRLKSSVDEITAMLSSAVILTNGVVQDKHLSGEDIERAKKVRKLHRCLHISMTCH